MANNEGNRSADATIKGYYYQFDKTILEILNLADHQDSLVVEGVEDIDLSTATEQSAIQCKYLPSKKSYQGSIVRKPIILMLDHFLDPQKNTLDTYILFAHFEAETPGDTKNYDVDELKGLLTYTEKKKNRCYYTEKGMTDAQLADFLNRFTLVFGEEFSMQHQRVLKELQTQFQCSDFEVDFLFYNNSLRVVLDLASEKDKARRIITKGDFLKRVNVKNLLRSEWYIQLKGKEKYLSRIKEQLKANSALVPTKKKVILIGERALRTTHPNMPLQSFVENLISQFFCVRKHMRDAQPITLIIEADQQSYKEIKREVLAKNIRFNDGYESVSFHPSYFNEPPVLNANKSGKITKTSFSLRLLSHQTFSAHYQSLFDADVVISFSGISAPVGFVQKAQYFDVPYCENLQEVYRILNS